MDKRLNQSEIIPDDPALSKKDYRKADGAQVYVRTYWREHSKIMKDDTKQKLVNDAMTEVTEYAHEEVPDIDSWMPGLYPDEKNI